MSRSPADLGRDLAGLLARTIAERREVANVPGDALVKKFEEIKRLANEAAARARAFPDDPNRVDLQA